MHKITENSRVNTFTGHQYFNILQNGEMSGIAAGTNGVITAEQWAEANEGIDVNSIRTNVHTHNRRASEDGTVFGLAFPSKQDISTAGKIDIVIGTYVTDTFEVKKSWRFNK